MKKCSFEIVRQKGKADPLWRAYPKAVAAPQKFREDLAYIKKHLSLSYKDLAEAIGVTRRCVIYWERGKRAPNIGAFVLVTDWANSLRTVSEQSK